MVCGICVGFRANEHSGEGVDHLWLAEILNLMRCQNIGRETLAPRAQISNFRLFHIHRDLGLTMPLVSVFTYGLWDMYRVQGQWHSREGQKFQIFGCKKNKKKQTQCQEPYFQMFGPLQFLNF